MVSHNLTLWSSDSPHLLGRVQTSVMITPTSTKTFYFPNADKTCIQHTNNSTNKPNLKLKTHQSP